MKLRILSFLLLIHFITYSQEQSIIKYYKSKRAKKEVEKSDYKLTITSINDSINEHLFINTKKDQKIWKKVYLYDKQYGFTEFYNKKGGITRLRYGKFIPEGVIVLTEENFKKDFKPNPNFKMPIINGEKNGIRKHIRRHFRYPPEALSKRIQGKVLYQFAIDKEGKIKDRSILESGNKLLDKETFRIISLIPDGVPAELNNEKIEVYIILNINFVIL